MSPIFLSLGDWNTSMCQWHIFRSGICLSPWGRKCKRVTKHFLLAFATLGVSEQIKTDNGLAYVSKNIEEFLSQWGVKHNTGILHSSTGQSVVERAHQTIKRQTLSDLCFIFVFPEVITPKHRDLNLLQCVFIMFSMAAQFQWSLV